MPPLIVALRYQAIYHVPVSDLFSGAYETEQQTIEDRLATMEDDLQQRSAKGRDAAVIARKLEWMWERRNPEQPELEHASEHS